MFMDCTQLSAIDISNWNVEKVTTMGNMFTGANLLTDDVLDFFKYGVQKSVTNIKSRFDRNNFGNLITLSLQIDQTGVELSNSTPHYKLETEVIQHLQIIHFVCPKLIINHIPLVYIN